MRPRKSIDDMQRLAAKHGGVCLSKSYISAKTKLLWRCAERHRWESTPDSVQAGSWCTHCSQQRHASKRLKAMHELAARKGGRCLSTTYTNNLTKLRWQCSNGHAWQASPAGIAAGYWCAQCVGVKPLTLADMQRVAAARGGKCLSKQYSNVRTRLRWKCSEGHIWDAKPGSIRAGKWCPRCGNGQSSIQDMRNLAAKKGGQCLSKEYANAGTRLKWKCADGHAWEAAGGSIRQGTWCPICSCSARLTIRDMQQAASERGGKCISTAYVNAVTKLKWKCADGHVWEANAGSVRRGTWCPACAGKALNIRDMQQVAAKRGGKCLSNSYVDGVTKLKWECAEGHTWEAKPCHVRRGQWCPRCIGRNRTIGDMRAFAAERGGDCVSKTCANSSTKLKWRCADGHTWEATPTQLITSGSWCPSCAGRPHLTISDMQQLAAQRGGECLSEQYANAKSPLEWKCRSGHLWTRGYDSVKQGSWCHQCVLMEYLEQIQQQAAELGGKCLSNSYVNVRTALRWECAEGHTWDAAPIAAFPRWCARCSAEARALKKLQALAIRHGGLCLSEKLSSRGKLEWECAEGHAWKATAANVQKGNWCPLCRRTTAADLRGRAVMVVHSD